MKFDIVKFIDNTCQDYLQGCRTKKSVLNAIKLALKKNSWQNCNGYEQLKGYMTVCEQVKKCEDSINVIKELKKVGSWEEVKKELEEACVEYLDNNGKVINFPGRLN